MILGLIKNKSISTALKLTKSITNQSNLANNQKMIRSITSSTFQDKINEKIESNLNKNTQIGIERANKIENKLKEQIEKNERLKKKSEALSLLSTAKKKSVKFMKEYGKLGLANYWVTWSAVFGSSYMSFRYGLVDYHLIDWLPVDKVEDAVLGFSKKYIGLDITINKKFEDLVAALAFSKITKPIQWVYVYFSTPTLAKLLYGSKT